MERSGRHPVARVLVILLCVMLVLFPKGGIRLGGLPLTWGYVLLFLSVLITLPYRMLALKTMYVPRQIVALLSVVPFWLVVLYSFLGYGVDGGYAGLVTTVTSLVFLPLLFLWYYPPMMPIVDRDLLIRLIRFCVLAAAIFGIFVFFWSPFTGSFLQVPYLSMNAGDSADYANTKNIRRGFFFKLISTYNNGNLYGTSTFLLLRIFDEIAPKRWQRWILRVALFLTLSRTIWAGLIFDLLLSLAAVVYEQKDTFPRVRLGRATSIVVLSILSIPIFLGLTSLSGLQGGSDFLLDPSLGGRAGRFSNLQTSSFIPNSATDFFLTEITYTSAVDLYGYVGAVAVSIFLLSPLLIFAMDRRVLQDRFRRAAFKSLLIYALISTSDGAISYIPVMAFYWFVYAVFLFGMPGRDMAYPVALAPSAHGHTDAHHTEPLAV